MTSVPPCVQIPGILEHYTQLCISDLAPLGHEFRPLSAWRTIILWVVWSNDLHGDSNSFSTLLSSSSRLSFDVCFTSSNILLGKLRKVEGLTVMCGTYQHLRRTLPGLGLRYGIWNSGRLFSSYFVLGHVKRRAAFCLFAAVRAGHDSKRWIPDRVDE